MRTIKTRIHSGLQKDCRVCTEVQPKKDKRWKRETKEKHVTVSGLTADIAVRRMLAAELGEDEPTKDAKFQLLQKYGIAAPRIDRGVTKSKWMSEGTWKIKQSDWFKATKGLVPQDRQRNSGVNPKPFNKFPNSKTSGRNSRQNFAPARTENRLS